jgi:hypothetical protein
VEQQESSSEPHLTHPTPLTFHHLNMVTYTTPIHPQPHGSPPLLITSKQARNNPTLRQDRKQWVAYLKRQERPPVSSVKQEIYLNLKPQNKHAKQSTQAENQDHQKETLKNKRRNTNRKRQKFPTSSFYSPTPNPTPSYHKPSKQLTQTKLSQTKFTNDSKMKGGKGALTLQHKRNNSHPITTHHPHQMSIFLTETNHRHLLVDFADWLQNELYTRTPLPHHLNYKTTTTYPVLRPPTRHGNTSTRNLNNRFHTHKTTTISPTRQTFQPNHHLKTRMPAIPIDTLANACDLGCEVPIRPRNPHRRGTAKFTKRQNINRNLRLHLRNDRKTVQNDSILTQAIQDTHYNFYCTLSSFDQWNHARQVFPHERTLITRWANIYHQGKAAALRFAQFPDTQKILQIMTRILVQHVKRTLTIAESGTLIRQPIASSMRQTPLNSQ